MLIWNPTAANLGSRRLVALLTHWNGLRDSGDKPPLAERWSLADLGPLGAYTMLLAVEDNGDFHYLHYGSGIARHYGEDLSGRRLSAIGGHVAIFAAGVYAAVALRQEPLFTEHEAPRHVFVQCWHRVVLPLRDESGRISRIVVGSIPEDPIRAIIDTVVDGMLAIDEAGRIRILNPAVQSQFGYDEQELLGQQLSAILTFPAGHAVGRSTEGMARRRDGTEFPVEVSVGETLHAGGKLTVAVIRDITARKADEAEMRRLAYHDPLTGAANRALFDERFAEAVARAKRDRRRVGVIMLDLDQFKSVNDTYGHAVGDALLCRITRRLASIVRETDLLARFGGDEFAVLLTGLRDASGATAFASRILARLAAPVIIGGVPHMIRASLGIAVSLQSAAAAESLLRSADEALYAAKGEGGNRYVMAGPAGAIHRRQKA